MRRMLATFALAILAGTAVAATVENIIVKNGDNAYVREAGKNAEKEMENVFRAAVRSGIARRR